MTSQELPNALSGSQSFTTPGIPFMENLNLPNLTKLTNDAIYHDATWPAMSTKIPKFEGKVGEDPCNHVMSFQLWCSSNSVTKDSI